MTITYTTEGQYFCNVCHRNFDTDDSDDVHTEPFSGGDCCVACCPRCNSEMDGANECQCGSLRQVFDTAGGGKLFKVECQECGRKGPLEISRQAAVDEWNKCWK